MKPIALNGSEVRAILDGRKTQMRRLARHRHGVHFIGGQGDEDDPECWGWSFDGPDHNGYMVLARGLNQRHDHGLVSMPCSYGDPGDRLWVRETFCLRDPEHHPERGYWYAATDDVDEPRWSPSIHMPRAASRITLLITDVRVQRLQEISEDDARAEGLHWWSKDGELRKWGLAKRHVSGELDHVEPWAEMAHSHTEAFGRLWDSINGKRATWASNPWVWALSFEVTNG